MKRESTSFKIWVPVICHQEPLEQVVWLKYGSSVTKFMRHQCKKSKMLAPRTLSTSIVICIMKTCCRLLTIRKTFDLLWNFSNFFDEVTEKSTDVLLRYRWWTNLAGQSPSSTGNRKMKGRPLIEKPLSSQILDFLVENLTRTYFHGILLLHFMKVHAIKFYTLTRINPRQKKF